MWHLLVSLLEILVEKGDKKMKQILAIAMFLVSLAVMASMAHAESNPLLTVFEVIKTGTNATLAKYVSYAVYGYENCKNACSISSIFRSLSAIRPADATVSRRSPATSAGALWPSMIRLSIRTRRSRAALLSIFLLSAGFEFLFAGD